jgi:hypothetical protein
VHDYNEIFLSLLIDKYIEKCLWSFDAQLLTEKMYNQPDHSYNWAQFLIDRVGYISIIAYVYYKIKIDQGKTNFCRSD